MNESEIKPALARIAKFNALKERESNLSMALSQLMSISGNNSEVWQIESMSFEAKYEHDVATKRISIRATEIDIYEIRTLLAPVVVARLDAVRKEIEEL